MVELEELGRTELKRIAKAPRSFIAKAKGVRSKRAQFVVSEILKHGYCTTKRIQEEGYDHPPRAARDVRECGIDLITERYDDPIGARLGVYYFGDFNKNPMASKTSGRSVLSNTLKKQLIDKYGSRCFIFLEELPEGKLQVDHRIPYEIAGEQDESVIDNFMLLSASANRRKSWECEHCPNWAAKDVGKCATCYWAHPENYAHIACLPTRQVALTVEDADVVERFDSIVRARGKDWLEAQLKEEIQYYILSIEYESNG